MPIGLFVDGSFVYKTYPGAIDYLKLREVIEADTGDRIDEAYYFNAVEEKNGDILNFRARFRSSPPPAVTTLSPCTQQMP